MTHWPHTPRHILTEKGVYMVTAATYQKVHYFNSAERLRILHDSLLQLAHEYEWKIQAWAVLSNHYHFIAESPDKAANLPAFLSQLHLSDIQICEPTRQHP